MEPPNGHPCPECGAPRQRDNTPSCACTHRAAEALLDARTTQAAAAEDFDPLRIRPYVEIDTGDASGGRAGEQPSDGRTPGEQAAGEQASREQASVPYAEAAHPGGAAPPVSPADVTAPLPVVDPGATAALPAASGISAAPATSAVPAPLTSATTEPSVTDLRVFDGSRGTDRGAPEPGESSQRRPRRRSTLLVVAAGACVAVVAAAGYATGLFSYESPSRDTALPDDIRASVPDAPSSSAAPSAAEGSATAVEPAPAAPRPSPSRSAGPSASPSPSVPSASASPSQSPSPSAPQTSPPATGAGQAPPENSRQKGGPTVLRIGDRGPEVTELQLRLRQLNLYIDDADGDFDDRLQDAVRTYQWSRGIQTDDLGAYDAETRTKLESETKQP
ncbi:peptidoglycan-binding protein [Streptomyces sp. NPDC101110]|uniref:peptidoglycan-binding protein n=1 Tax=Streptomyces sp. NPDC101110 TaxID=3366104 RepID=UPI0038119C23